MREGAQVAYRPTVHYAYHPCDAAVLSVHEFAGRNWHMQDRKRILMDDIINGIDELGVLLAGHKKNAYWYGSQLSIEEARKLVPAQQRHQPAGHRGRARREWCGRWRTRTRGIVEPDEMDFRRNLEICMPVSRAAWSASTPTGRRCTIASGCSRRTSTSPIRGSSRTCGFSGEPGAAHVGGSAVGDRHDRVLLAARGQLHGRTSVVQRLAKQRAAQRRVHADVAGPCRTRPGPTMR